MIFDSNFECGNLDRATIASLGEYNLFLHVDTNSRGHAQWFYFAVTNTEQARTVKFNILNCSNPVYLSRMGMRPLVFSELSYESTKQGWTADTFDVGCTRNCIPRGKGPAESSSGGYFTLTFSHKFRYSGDRVYFAYARPYSVSMLRAFLEVTKQSLAGATKSVTALEDEGLKQRIDEFVEEAAEKQAETISDKKDVCGSSSSKLQAEDQFKLRLNKRKEYIASATTAGPVRSLTTQVPETALVASEVLKQFADKDNDKSKDKPERFSWLRSRDFQIDTEMFVYRLETLSRTLSGIPIELITITAQK